MRRGAVVVALAAVLAATPGCEIQPDTAPRDIPVDDRGQLVPVDPEAGETGGSSRVFLLSDADDDGERQLHSVLRDVEPTAPAVLEELLNGPNPSELEAGLSTALPDGLTLRSAPRSVAGTLNVDVSAEILELPRPLLVLAVAEIVFTGNELEGVREVRLRVDGEMRAWPDGRGELTGSPLTVYDFPGLAESTQPPYPAAPSEPVA